MDEPQPGRKRRRRRISWLLIPFLAGLTWYGSRAVGYVADHRAYLIPSGSMAPALLPGDRVVAGIRGDKPGRGEIWVIAGPTSTLIKRVIGLPGETVEAAGGRVLINGQPLDEPYLTASTTAAMPPARLGPDQYFLMGDTRAASADSRAWGPVHASKFIGRAEHRFWPPDRVGPIR